MIIGVTGDTHNNLKNIEKICSIFNENKAKLVIHTGDITLPKSLRTFAGLNCPLIAVLGNNDVDEKEDLIKTSKEFDCEIKNEPFSEIFSNKRVTTLHRPDLISDEMIKTNDLILHGHTHRYRLEKKFGCVIFNPGECAGFMEGMNSVGIINLKNLKPEVVKF